MKLPFPMWTLNATVKVVVIGYNEDNAPTETILYSGKARYDRKSRQIMNAQRELINISGMVVCVGDIAFDRTQTVHVEVDGAMMRVVQTNKPANPDGSTYSTEFFLS